MTLDRVAGHGDRDARGGRRIGGGDECARVDEHCREYADGYIQIHHVKPLSQYEGKVDPATDMFPLCANCHVMAHRKKDTITSIGDLKALIEKAKG